MSTPPPPPGYGTLPPDPDEPQRGPYPTGQPSPYGQQPGPYGAPAPRTSTPMTLGYVSLGMGIFAIPAGCCCWFLAWIPALAALGTGAYGLSEVKNDPSTADAKPFLIAGIVLGAIGLLITSVTAVWGVASIFSGI